jgi:ferredoxin
MRVVVDFDLCESNALCMAAAPEVFEVRDDDFLYVLDEKVELAVQRCPKQAIKIED